MSDEVMDLGNLETVGGQDVPFGVDGDSGLDGSGREPAPEIQTAPPTDEQPNEGIDPNLTPENLKQWRAKLTQESQQIAQQRQEMTQKQQQYEQMQREYQSAQVAMEHPAVRQSMLSALNANAESVADQYIQKGLAQPHERPQLVAELRREAQHTQQPQPGVQQFQPQVDPNQISQQVMQQVNQQMKRQEYDRLIDAKLAEYRESFQRDTGKQPTQQDINGFMSYAMSIGQNPMEHAYKVMNYDRAVAEAEARGRAAAMQDLRKGPDPWSGGTVPDDGTVANEIDAVLNAS